MTAPELFMLTRPDVQRIEDVARKAEEDGWDGLALTDSQNLSPDTYVALTLAARATQRITLGPGVTNPLTRHAAVAAGAIASIHQLSGGRAMLGIGRGDSALFNIGPRVDRHGEAAEKAIEHFVQQVMPGLRSGESA